MRWRGLFGVYALIVLTHLVQIVAGLPGREFTKPALMGSLALVVLLVALRQRPDRRGRVAVVVLLAGILLSLAGDVLLGVEFVLGLGAFALAHLAYVALFLGPARRRRLPWWTLAYLAWYAVLVPVLWPQLGDLRLVVAGYGVVLGLTAATALGVHRLTAWGGLAFLASDSLLAFRLFWPDFGTVFPDPWQDLAIMALYCLGQGLIAAGVLRGLRSDGVGDP